MNNIYIILYFNFVFLNKAIVETSSAFQIGLEIFQELDLVNNITHIIPKHVVLTSKEKKEMFLKCKVQENRMNRLLKTDPVALYFGLVPGQVNDIIFYKCTQ